MYNGQLPFQPVACKLLIKHITGDLLSLGVQDVLLELGKNGALFYTSDGEPVNVPSLDNMCR